MKLYVGNLSYSLTEDELREVFQTFGQIASVSIIKDKFTGKSRGFGFVEMENAEDAKAAIAGLNGQEIKGLKIKVNESLPKKPQGQGGRRFDGGGYSNGGGRFNKPRNHRSGF